MRRGWRFGLGMVVALGLAACSGGDAVSSLELQLIKAGRAALAAQTAPEVERPILTRALLDSLEGAYLEVALERHDLLAYLQIVARRRDGDPGQITVWRTVDNITLATRGGVLIATRGMGGDLLSSNVQLAGDAPGPARGGERLMTIRTQDNQALHLALRCELTDLGPVTIEIVGHHHPTRHLRETCTGGVSGDGAGNPGLVVNDYWVDSRAGLVWKSRQWAGPNIGYLRLRRITR